MSKRSRQAARRAAEADQAEPLASVVLESEPLIGKELAAKILLVQKAVTKIPKKGENKAHNYKYVLAADAVEYVSLALNDANLVLMPLEIVDLDCTMKIGRDTPLTRVKIKYQLLDPDTGQFFNITWIGDGADAFDKGLNKAYTICFKYLIMQLFMVAGEGMDPESPAYDAAAPKQKPQRSRPAPAQAPAKPDALASETKMKYLNDLMAPEFIPGPIRTGVVAWLEKHDGKWSDSGATKTIEQLKKFWPVGENMKAATKKQTGLLAKFAKSKKVPKNVSDRVTEELSNFENVPDAVLTMHQASAMIECCQWYIDKGEAKTAAPKAAAETSPPDDDGPTEIESYVKRIKAQLAKRKAPNQAMLESVAEWLAGGDHKLTVAKAMLDDIRDWPMKESGS